MGWDVECHPTSQKLLMGRIEVVGAQLDPLSHVGDRSRNEGAPSFANCSDTGSEDRCHLPR
jgi:hypothetical protein